MDGTGCFCLLLVLALVGGGAYYIYTQNQNDQPRPASGHVRPAPPDVVQAMSDSASTAETQQALRRLEPFRLDSDWFSDFFNSIIAVSGVDADDDGNHMELVLFYMKILHDMATSTMGGAGDHRALQRFRDHPEVGFPHVAARLLIEWNGECRGLIVQKLKKFYPISVTAGREFGKIRIFPSPCHGKPREWDGEVSRCSQCGAVIPMSD